MRSVSQKTLGFWMGSAAVVVALDQLTKWIVLSRFADGERKNILPFFDFILTYNPGAAFSFLANAGGWQRWFFIVLAIVISAFIVAWLRKETRVLPSVALALILGGAVGNVIDRIVHEKVVDFLLFYWKDWYYPAFNLADSAITCGAVLLIWDSFFGPNPETKQ